MTTCVLRQASSKSSRLKLCRSSLLDVVCVFSPPEGQNCIWCKIQHKPNPYPMCVFSTMIIVTSREHFRCAPNPLRFVSYLVFSKLSNCRNVVNIVEKFQWTRVSQGYSCVPRPLIASPELFLETTAILHLKKSQIAWENYPAVCWTNEITAI